MFAPTLARLPAHVVESERARLMRADAVLASIVFALNHAEWQAESGTDYANAVQAVREIVQECITRLDHTSLKSSAVNPMQP